MIIQKQPNLSFISMVHITLHASYDNVEEFAELEIDCLKKCKTLSFVVQEDTC